MFNLKIDFFSIYDILGVDLIKSRVFFGGDVGRKQTTVRYVWPVG